MNIHPIIPVEEGGLILAAILALGLWPVWRSTQRLARPWRFASTTLRLAGLAALALLGLNPGRWIEESRARTREWAVLVDRSRSMESTDAEGGSRWNAAAREVRRIERMAAHPERIRWYTFAAELESAVDAVTLLDRQPGGDRTRLEEAVRSLLARYRAGDRKLTGILVMGDGRRVEPEVSEDIGLRARSRETPVYGLPFGGPVTRPDLSVTVARRQVIAFAGQPARVAARVRNHGLGPVRVRLQLRDKADRRLTEKAVDLAEGTEQTVAFEVAPSDADYAEYSIVAPVLESETIPHNNRAAFGVSTLPDRMQILLVEGAPYWDSKFLAQRLRRQPNIDVTAVYRLAAERYFVVRGEEKTHQTDLDTVFPVGAEALTRYDLILLGKGLDAILSPERLEPLNRYVRDQGGRIVFFRGKPYHGRFEALETLEPLIWGSPLGRPVAFQPLSLMQTAGLFGDILPDAGDPVWGRLPVLKNAHQAQPRAFTEVAATGLPEDLRGTYVRQSGDDLRHGVQPPGTAAGLTPLLAWRVYGRGLLAVVNAEGFWQWDFFPDTSATQDMYQEFWMQLLQWCLLRAEFMPGRDVAILLGAAATLPDTPVRVTVRRRAAVRTAPSAVPRLTVWRGDERVRELSMASGGTDENLWETVITLPDPGLYRVAVTMEDATNTLEAADAILRVKDHPTEMEDVSADPERLARLAESSGGRIIPVGELAETVRKMEAEPQVDAEGKARWQSAWDRASVLVLLLACFAGDIFVRRRNGLL